MDVATMRAFGFTEADMEDTNTFEILPDNWLAFALFEFLGTQWRTGVNGVIGLDYNVFPMAFDMYEVDKESQREVVQELRVMESKALSIINANKGK